MIKTLQTKRLILREIQESDVEGMFALDSDPEVHKYLGNKPVKTKEETVNIIKNIRQQYQDNGIGRWAIVDKETHDFIGWTGLKLEFKETNGHIGYYDLGYRLRREFWGKGIGFESALPFIDYGFNELNVEEICGAADVDNIGSNKILLKCGLKFIEQFEYDSIPCNWYSLRRKPR